MPTEALAMRRVEVLVYVVEATNLTTVARRCTINNQPLSGMTWVIIGSFLGFAALAFILLYPVYRFLRKEAARNKENKN